MKKGFTLIELLGVIIVLAVIALVTTPLVLDVVDEAKSNADFNSVSAYLEAAKLYYYEAQFDEAKMDKVQNIKNIYDEIIVKGEKPDVGELYVNETGKTAISVILNGKCYQKSFTEEIVKIVSSDDCSLGFTGEDKTAPTLEITYEGEEGNNGWYKSDLWVHITVTDSESGAAGIEWCFGSDCIPTELESVTRKDIYLEQNIETVICAIGYDRQGNASEKVCSKDIKIDKEGPSFSGISDLTVMKESVVDLRNEVTVEDNLSGVDGFTVTPETVETNIAGTTLVTYKAVDNAGNETTIERNIVVDALAPTVTYTAEEGKINANGWAKGDFFVDITINDQSGLGIKEFYVCTGNETDRCIPQEGSHFTNSNTAQRTVAVENDNNRICIQATDNNNRTSEVLCSDAYKLDKTAPVISGLSDIVIDIGGVIDLDTGVSVSDEHSQVDGTYSYTPVSISNTIVGITTVTYTAIDKAGNIATQPRTVEVLGSAPTISYSTNGTFNSNGWANANFNINATITDNSGKGIESIKYCLTTDAECAPVTDATSVSVPVSTNSDTNKICVTAIDKNNKSTTTCSGNYKLDKVAPSISNFYIGSSSNPTYVTTNTQLYLAWNDTDVESYCIATTNSSSGCNFINVSGQSALVNYTLSAPDGNKILYAFLKDRAGNISQVVSDSATLDSVAPTLSLSKITYQAGFSGWQMTEGSNYDYNTGIFTTDDIIQSPLYDVNGEPWYFEFDYLVTETAPACSSQGSYFLVTAYFDESQTQVNSSNGHSFNGSNKCTNLNTWTHASFDGYSGFGTKYMLIQFQQQQGYYGSPTVQVKNMVVWGQLPQSFYFIDLVASDNITTNLTTKLVYGTQTVDYFKTGGQDITGYTRAQVTKNGTYTLYVEDEAGNGTVQTIVIDRITS